MTEAYFTTDDGVWFRGTAYARGPWDVSACHAGPPTALIARRMEAEVTDKALVRLAVEIERPIPMGGFRVEAEIRRVGRSVGFTSARILDDDRVYATASGLHLREIEMEVATAAFDLPDFGVSVPGPFPVTTREQGFSSSLEMRYDPSASIGEGGPTIAWARTRVPVLVDEEPSGFQRVCPLADSGNGISHNEGLDRVRFINPDLVLSVHRATDDEWIGSRTLSHWQANGTGMADAELFDRTGPVGRATQSLLLDGVG